MVYTQKGDYHEKTKKKKIILTTIQILFVAFIGYYTYTLNRPGIHFIGNFAKFNVDKDYTMRVYQNEKGEAMPNPSRYLYQINGNKFKQKFKLTIMDTKEDVTYIIEK